MTRDEAIERLKTMRWEHATNPCPDRTAFDMAIESIEQVGCLTDRPCHVCRFKTENGCNRWECVFKGV